MQPAGNGNRNDASGLADKTLSRQTFLGTLASSEGQAGFCLSVGLIAFSYLSEKKCMQFIERGKDTF